MTDDKLAPMPQSEASISVRDLSHYYGEKRALDKVTFTVDRGKFCVVLGLNGAGKSTLFSLLTRLYSHQSGAISICGHSLQASSGKALRNLGVVFQARTIDLDMSIEQNLLYHAALQGISKPNALPRISEVLAQVELTERQKEKVRSLSGGQMRRVEIARALLHNPKVLLLDEATVGLDINSRSSILAIIRSLVQSEGISVLWATHLIDEVSNDDDLIVLHSGKVLERGSVQKILQALGCENVADAFANLTESTQVGRES